MIWVVDDFYPNPDEIRNRALMLDYTRGMVKKEEKKYQALHPGYRANQKRQFWWENRIYLRNRWKDILGKQVHDMESMKCNGSFNLGYGEKKNTFSWIHSDGGWDDHERMYACVIYLTPNPPPNTGTLLFEHDGSLYDIKNRSVAVERYPHYNGEYSDVDGWTVHCKVENRYNRLVMYDARMLHTPENAGFGDTKETARLTQIGFWYGEDKLQI